MAEQRVTDEQLTEWDNDAKYGGSRPSAHQVVALISDLRASRAQAAELARDFLIASDRADEWCAEEEKRTAERDVLQQRIDKVLAMCDAADTDLTPRIMFVELLDPRTVRAALTGAAGASRV